jgi:hypothetical protein
MRTWIWGGCLAALTASGVYLVFAGAGASSHCGPCVAHAEAAARPCCSAAAPQCENLSPVVTVVDVPAALAPAEPNRLPFVSFDEPPLAPQPVAAAPVPDIIPAAFTEPAPVETAPMPRPASLPLAQPNDPF